MKIEYSLQLVKDFNKIRYIMTMYNRFIILIIICFSTNVLLSQVVNVTLTTNPNPPAQLSEWVNQTGLAFFTVTNTDLSLQGSPYKIQVDMFTDDNTLVVTTNNNVITQQLDYLNPQVFNAEDLIPSSALVFPNPSFENTLIQTSMLPAGSYWFCVTVISVNGDFSTLPPQACSFMMVTDYQMPELILPLPNQEISSLSLLATQFNWSPMIPASPQGLKYILAVSEVQNGQTPYQAFLTNFPVIEEETFNTQFFWPPDLDPPTEQTQYIWSVKPVSNDNLPYIQSGNGFVVPETFTVNPMIDLQQNNDTLSLDTICNCMDFKAQFITSIQPFIQQSISSGTFPELTINQPESILYPTKVEIGGVTEIRDYLFDCIDPTTASVVIASADINWSPSSSPENILNNGPFEYQYAVGEQIPDFITVTYRIENTPAYENFLCEKVAWVAVPQSLLDLNNIDNSGTVNIGETVYVGEVINGQGEFECIIDSVTTTNNNHTGKGTVKVPWLASRMAVEFSNITIDANNNLSSGEVVVESYLTAPDTTQLGSVYVGAVTNFINNNGNYATPMASFNGALSAINYITTPKKMPFGVMSSKGDSISLVNMVFYNNRSEYDLVTLKRTSPKFQSQNIGFKATNVKFSLMNPVSVPERIELVEDVLIGNTNSDVYFYFLTPSPNNTGCYIDFDENGFQQFGVALSAKFTRDWFIPLPDDGVSRSTASLSTVATNWDDLILTGMFEESEIVDANGITVLASDISMDMSDVMNPSSIIFPANYVGETTNLFTGFFMEDLTVKLPANLWETPTGGPIEIAANNMIIDNTGLTVMLNATNVVLFDSAKISDLSCSVDLVSVEIQSSSLVEASIEGEIGLPVANTVNMQNPLEYTGIFHHTQGPLDVNYVELSIEPTGPVFSDLFQATICVDSNTSSLTAYADPTEKRFQIDIDGTMFFSTITTANHTIPLNLGFEFNGLDMGYNSNTGLIWTPPVYGGFCLGLNNCCN